MQGLEYLKSIKTLTNVQIVKTLMQCSEVNGGCESCSDRKECQKEYDARFAEFATYMTIELAKEHDILKMLKAKNNGVLIENLTTIGHAKK